MKTRSLFLGFLCCAVASAGEGGGQQTLKLSLPGEKWALEFDAGGFEIKENQLSPQGDARKLFAVNRRTGINMSVFMEKAAGKGGSRACRTYYWSRAKQSPFKKDGVRLYQRGLMALVEYTVKEFRGVPVNQKNINAYLAKGDTWIDVHLSKVQYVPADRKLFDSVLKSVKIDVRFTPTSFDQLAFASHFFMLRDYEKATVYYEKALALEKKSPELEKKMWYVLIDNLGMAYGISGRLKEAKETFEYGLSKSPEYPMFHYNLACTYAEMNDLGNAVECLKKAFEYEANMIRGERMPDPRKDSSFKRFLGEPEFLRALEEIGM